MIGKSGVGWVVAILTYLGLLGHWANVSEVGGGVIEWQGRYEVWAFRAPGRANKRIECLLVT